MIAYLKGFVADVSETSLILDVNQVGYRVFISSRDAAAMPARGGEVQIYTWLSVSQDAFRLYGFLDADDLAAFKLLLNVSGIGPKAALGILSVMTADELRFAVLSDDVKAISKAPGIGGRTAQKVILELKDKISLSDTFEHKLVSTERAQSSKMEGFASAREEAVQALIALGYSNSEALRAVQAADLSEEMDTTAILRQALKQMA